MLSSHLLKFNFIPNNIKSKRSLLKYFSVFIIIIIFFSMIPYLLLSDYEKSSQIADSNEFDPNQIIAVKDPFQLNDREYLIADSDKDKNLIHDSLDNFLSKINNLDIINIILVMKNGSTPLKEVNLVINEFKMYGGTVTKILNELGMITGTIPINNLQEFALKNSNMKTELSLIELDREMVKLSNEAVKLTNINSAVWGNLNLRGDKNGSIAILDSGIDDSHPILGNYNNLDFENESTKIVGWFDATNDGATEPEDFDGHGTHVAGIAAGRPSNNTDSSGNVKVSWTTTYDGSSGVVTGFGSPINVSVANSGTFNLTYKWRQTGSGLGTTEGTGLYLIDPDGFMVASDFVGNNISFSFSFSYNVRTKFGIYQIWPLFDYGNTDHTLDMFTYGTIPPTSGLLNTSSQFSGVAPETKIVAVKVFNNVGSGLGSYLVSGIEWIIANKNLYHITVASMSLGFPCGVSGCNSSYKVTSVELAVNNLVDAGIISLVSAGNDGNLENNQIGSPGNLDKVITVGATDDYHLLTNYSSRGPGLGSISGKPDLTAPGGVVAQGSILQADTNDNEVKGTSNGIVSDFQSNDLTGIQGTSMAAPHVAGIASLMVQAMGGYNNWNYSLTEVFRVKQYLLMSTWANFGTDRGEKDIYEGWGEIQAGAAVGLITSSNYLIGTNLTVNLSDDRISTKIWGRQMNLTGGIQFDFLINMSNGLDVDVYIYEQEPDQFGNPVIAFSSKTNGLGATETFSFTPTSSGNFFIFIKVWNGTGSFTLSSSNMPSPPIIIGINTVKFLEGQQGFNISWDIIDFDPKNYSLYLNNTEIENGSISGFITINKFIDGLTKGVYNYTIQVYDILDLESIFTTLVYVSILPEINNVSGDITYIEGDTGNSISWIITDDNLKIYSVFYPNQSTQNFLDPNRVLVNVTVDGLSAQVDPYNYTLMVTDFDNNSVVSSIFVTVQSLNDFSSTITDSDSSSSDSSSISTLDSSKTSSTPQIITSPGLLLFELMLIFIVIISFRKKRKMSNR